MSNSQRPKPTCSAQSLPPHSTESKDLFMANSFCGTQHTPFLRLHHLQSNNPFLRFSLLSPKQKPLLFNSSVCASRFTHYRAFTSLSRRRPSFAINALHSDVPHPHQGSVDIEKNKRCEKWDSLTSKFSGAANIPFLLLQMPQIILNAQNLMAGNKTALLAVPWLGMLTSLLGNLSLLSYFAKKREKEAMIVQTLGAVSTYVVLVQLALAEAMPLPHFLATSVVVASGLVLNFTNYFGLLNAAIWRFWEDFITVGGLSVLPQIMWSTFVPYVPNSILPGITAFVLAIVAVILARTGKLSEKGVRFVGLISGWTATFLFMWMPISQMWTNFLNPENIKGLSAFSILLAMIGNGLMIPRALFIRDFMWFIGSAWATFLYGYGNIACLYFLNVIRKEFFLAATGGLVLWIGCPLCPFSPQIHNIYQAISMWCHVIPFFFNKTVLMIFFLRITCIF